jgi:hypothetical protein
MVNLDKMSREELIEVIRVKDQLLKELREEIEAYALLVEELRGKLGKSDHTYSGNGD